MKGCACSGAGHGSACSNVNVLRDSPPLAPDAILGPDGTQTAERPESATGRLESQERLSSPLLRLGSRPLPVERPELGPGHVDGDQQLRHGLVEQLPRHEQQHALRPGPVVGGLRAKRLERIARADERIRSRATAIVEAAMMAGAIDPAGQKPEFMTDKQWRIARANWSNMKARPGFIDQAQRIWESYKKAENDRPAAPTINAEVVQVQVNTYNYPRRRLTE